MSGLLHAWPQARPDLLRVSLLMLAVAAACLATAAKRTRHPRAGPGAGAP